MGCSKGRSKRDLSSNTSLPQPTRKTTNKQPGLTPKAPEKDKHKERHPNDQSRKERAAKKTIGKINAATTASLNTSTIWINP